MPSLLKNSPQSKDLPHHSEELLEDTLSIRAVALALSLLLGSTLLWFLLSPIGALLWLTLWLLMHYYHQYQLRFWLHHQRFRSEGFGTWGKLFRRMARSQRKQIQKNSAQQQQIDDLQQALHRLPNGVAIVNSQWHLEWENEVFCLHLGVRPKDRGIRLHHLARQPDLVNYLTFADFTQALEFNYYDRDLWLQVIRLTPYRFLIVTQDRSAQVKVDRIRRDFVANASHELGSPLTVIHGYLALLQGKAQMPDIASELQTLLPILYQESERMLHVIEDMRTLSQLEKDGDAPFSYQHQVTLNGLVARVVQAVNSSQSLLLENSGQHLIQFSGPTCVLAIPEPELFSALYNLLSNAIRYSPQGGDILLSWQVRDNKEFAIAVKDHGIGVAPEHIPRLCERFYRVDQGRSRPTRSTGLGLAIVKHTVQRAGGRLEIDSVLGQGSCFTLVFPGHRIVS